MPEKICCASTKNHDKNNPRKEEPMEQQLPPLIIPGFVIKKPISHTAMVLYGLIFSLQREEGYAWASNAYYAESLGLSIASVKRYLKELTEARLILVHLNRYATDMVQRRIFLYSSMTAFRAYEEEGNEGGRQLKSEPYIQDTTSSTSSTRTSRSSRLSRAELTEVIEPIYKNYPRKIGKTSGLDKLFQKHFSSEDLPKFAAAVSNYSAYCKSQGLEARFILHFNTFVGRWRDWEEVQGAENIKQQSVTTLNDLAGMFNPKTWEGAQNEK